MYSSPATEFVAQFVGSVSRLPGEMVAPGTVNLWARVFAVPPATRGAELPVGRAVDVLVRPESVRLRPSPLGRRWSPGLVPRCDGAGGRHPARRGRGELNPARR